MDAYAVAKLVVLGLGLGTYVASRVLSPRRRALRRFRRIKITTIAQLQDGASAHVVGAAATLNETLKSPLDGRVCLGYSSLIEEKIGAGRGSQVDDWIAVWSEQKCVPFLLSDGVSQVVVQGPFELGLDVDDRGDVWANLPPALFAILEKKNIDVGGKELRFKESFLLPGDQLHVFGRASAQPAADGARDAPRGPPMRRVLSGTADKPVVIADVQDDLVPGR